MRAYNFRIWGEGRAPPQDLSGFGAALKRRLRVPGPWQIGLYAIGEVLPRSDNRVLPDDKQIDRFGMPLIRFDFSWRDDEMNMIADSVKQAVRMPTVAGFVDIETRTQPNPPGSGIHEMGTARMGNNPRKSVVNRWDLLHDAANVFGTDGAAMSSGSCVNPPLTFMALTARAANHAVELVRANQI